MWTNAAIHVLFASMTLTLRPSPHPYRSAHLCAARPRAQLPYPCCVVCVPKRTFAVLYRPQPVASFLLCAASVLLELQAVGAEEHCSHHGCGCQSPLVIIAPIMPIAPLAPIVSMLAHQREVTITRFGPMCMLALVTLSPCSAARATSAAACFCRHSPLTVVHRHRYHA